MFKRISLLIAVALMAVMMLAATAGVGYAKITPAEPPTCENNGGQLPGGQQPNCKNDGGLTQNEGTCAQNPQDKCPRGQQ